MKKKFSSILGVGLALVLAFTMAGGAFLAAPAPEAEAATLAWSTLAIPSTANNQLAATTAELGPVAPSPNFGTDQTVFAAVNDAGVETVYKSIDGGHTWVASSSAPLDTLAPLPIVALAVSNQYATDSTVVVATADYVYRSTDGGATFSQLGGAIGGTPATLVITCLDISPNYDGIGIIVIGLIDTAPGATPPTGTEVRVWGYDGALNWTNFGLQTNKQVDVTSVKFSPKYAIDTTLLAVGSGNTTSGIPFPGTQLYTKVSDNAWDISIVGSPTMVASAVTSSGNVTSGIIFSSIALPGDYDGTKPTLRRAYVSVTSSSAAVLGAADGLDDVYRVTNVTAGVDMELNQRLVNIDYAGDFATGTVIGGLYGAAALAADTYYTTNPTDSVVNWYAATNPLSGTTLGAGATCYIAMDKDYLTSSTVFAGTVGTDSAFAVSRDGAVNWTETGLIDTTVPNVLSVALSSSYATDSTIWLLTADGGAGNDSVWRSENAGTYWERMHWMALGGGPPETGQLCLSAEYGTNGVVYVGDTGTTAVYYSDDKGQEWSAPSIPALRNVLIGSMAAPDATTLYIGASGNGNVAKSINNGWGWTAANTKPTGSTGNIDTIIVADSVVVVGDSGGAVFRSTDAGATWAQVGTTTAAWFTMYVQMDGDTLYAATSGNGLIYRFIIDVSTAWDQIGRDAASIFPGLTPPTTAAGLALAPDGTLYEAVAAPAAVNQQVARSINPTEALPTPDVFFEYMTGLTNVATAAISVAPASLGNEVAIIQGATVQVFSDTLSLGTSGPVLVAPADETVVADTTNVVFQIEAITNVTIYDVFFSRDPNFTYTDGRPTITAPAVVTATQALIADADSYWMARSQAGAPLRGAWSEVWKVSPQPTTPLNAPTLNSPGGWAGTTEDVSIHPVFNWTAFKYADGYELQVARDNLFTDLELDLTGENALGNVTSYAITGTLEYDTTYYWRVRALSGTVVTSDWSAAVGFTTESAPAVWTCSICGDTFATEAELSAHIGSEHPTTPTTPAYVWAIIAVGFVLVIAVIVLITRTRRVV